MISKDTPIGAEIVCIDVKGLENFVCERLEEGSVYTVREIVEHARVIGGYGVRLNEVRNKNLFSEPIEGAYSLSRFRYLSRYASETSYTTTAPVDDSEREKPREPAKEKA